ncbi:MAG: HEAT repeat domain-containing protein [Spirochaetaceae bacterium]|nr:HEAT repeat domain-containing protein [Spirochaetaceae bacterium]
MSLLHSRNFFPTGILCLLILGSPLYAQETEESRDEVDKREQTLLYGIDSEVMGVLGDLQQDKIGSYNDILTTVVEETRNRDIIQGIYRLWNDTDYLDGLPLARRELAKVTEDEDYETSVVQTAMAFIADQEDGESIPLLMELSSHRDSGLAASAVRSIAKMPPEDIDATSLLDRLKKEDPVSEEDLIAALIVTLGELGYTPAADELVMIAEDAGASAGHRRLACVSIGQIGRESDYQVVENIYFESDDAMLRSYALAGLAEFPGHETDDILIQALKRDSFWRIRVTAAEKLSGADSDEIGDLLMYKAANDPVNHVRIASLRSLGSISGGKYRRFLLDYYKNERHATDVRLACLSVLVENQIPGTKDAVNTVMDELWEKDPGRFLEFTCRDLSLAEWKDLAPVYERMLDHPSWLIQIYGIRGIRRNGIASLEGRVTAMDADGFDGRVRREITTSR